MEGSGRRSAPPSPLDHLDSRGPQFDDRCRLLRNCRIRRGRRGLRDDRLGWRARRCGGLPFVFLLFDSYCDDALAKFSNFGPVVDIAAPGVQIFSSYAGGGYQNQSGTSMAVPHVAGVAALVRGANRSLSPAQVADVLRRSGIFPDGRSPTADVPRARHGERSGRRYGAMVNALRAVEFATGGGGVGLPNVILTPSRRRADRRLAALTATASDPQGITSVDFLVDGVQVGSDSSSPYAVTWDTDQVVDCRNHHRPRDRWRSARSCVAIRSRQVIPRSRRLGGGMARRATCLAPGTAPANSRVLPGASLTLLQGHRFLYGPNGEGALGRERDRDRAPPGGRPGRV